MSQEDLEFKRSLINEISKYPEIWKNNKNRKNNNAAWNKVQKALNTPLTTLRMVWASLRRHYFLVLMTKTIEHDNTAPKWKLFHDMSFMYEKIKEVISKKMGGISPPMLRPLASTRSSSISTCPCCLPHSIVSERNVIASMASLDAAKKLVQPLETPSSDAKFIEQHKHFSGIKIEESSTNSLKRPMESSSSSLRPVKVKRPAYTSTREKRSVEREKIINAIKSYPVLYAKNTPGPKCSLSFAWKKVAEEVGIPILTIQNRWRLFKQRYVDELMRQRYANGSFQSNWQNFEQMTFMREHMKSDIENIDRIRQEIQQIVKEQRNRQTIDLCTEEDDTYMVVCDDSNQSSSRQTSYRVGETKPKDVAPECKKPITLTQPSIFKETSRNSSKDTDLIGGTYLVIYKDSNDANDTNRNPPSSSKGIANAESMSPVQHNLFKQTPRKTSNRSPQFVLNNQCIQSDKSESTNIQKPSVITLDLTSDEEDDIICFNDTTSMGTDSSVEIYEEEIVYFSEPLQEDIICLDDDDAD